MTAISAIAKNEETSLTPRAPVRTLLRVNLIATLFAAAATEALTAIVRAAGVHLAVGTPGGDAASVVPINAGACAITLAMCMVVGAPLAVLINRYASRPARTYCIATGLLVLASLAAPLTAADTGASTKLTLIAAHLIAAAIIVPLVSRQLARAR